MQELQHLLYFEEGVLARNRELAYWIGHRSPASVESGLRSQEGPQTRYLKFQISFVKARRGGEVPQNSSPAGLANHGNWSLIRHLLFWPFDSITCAAGPPILVNIPVLCDVSMCSNNMALSGKM